MAQTGHACDGRVRTVMRALVAAAIEELGTDRVILVASIPCSECGEREPLVSVSAGAKRISCGMLGEALISVGSEEVES